MHVQHALVQALQNFLGGKECARQIRGGIREHFEFHRHDERGEQTEDAARDGENQLAFPLVNVMVVVGNLHFARGDLGKGNVAPAPEFRRGRTGDAGDGRGGGVAADGDFLLLVFGKRLAAVRAITFAGEQRAGLAGGGILGGRNLGGDFGRELFHVGAAKRGDGNLLLRGVNRHRLQRGFLGQRVHDGAREALGGIGFAFVLGNWRHGHGI